MREPSLSQRVTTMVAVLACVLFALGVRDTPERPLPASGALVTLTSAQLVRLRIEVNSVDNDPPSVRPLAGATLRVYWNDQNRFRLVGSARSNAQGRALLESLPRGAVWIIAEAEGRARSSTQLVLDGDERVARLSLPRAQRLDLAVLDEQGSPLENATLLVTSGDPLPYGALTDRNGAATFTRLGPGPYRVKAQARGYESVQMNRVTERTVLTLRRLGSLRLTVLDGESEPVAGAVVSLVGTTLWPARTFTTNADGIATVRGLLAGSYDLRARKERLVSATELGLTLGRGEERQLTLRLVAGRFVTVWVTDGEGEPAVPVPNADVVVAENGISAFPERGRSGSDGRVELGPFEPGALSASATAPDFVGSALLAVPDNEAGPLRLPLRRGGTVVGTVVDSYDHPIAGASIEIVGTDFAGMPIAETPEMRELQAVGFERALGGPVSLLPMGELGVTKGPVPGIPGAIGGDYLLESDSLRSTLQPLHAPSDTENWVTRYDGSFRAHPVTPGRLRAVARHPAYVEGQSELVTLQARSETEVKIVLRAGGSLEGLVVDRYGRPVGGARVELSSSTDSRSLATYTADDGAFAFAALPPEIQVSVSRPENPEQAVVRERLTVREGKRESVRIVLPEARENVECLVVDERGDPIESAEVRLSSLEVTAALRQTRFTSVDGLASFADARGLDVQVSVESPGYAPTEVRQDHVGERLRLVLRRGVIVSGRVTQVRGRFPVGAARITLVSGGRRRIVASDAEGIFRITDVPDGTVHLIVEGPNLPSLEVDRKIERQSRDDRAFDLGEFDLPEAGGITGVVVDARGNAVVGARVSAHASADESARQTTAPSVTTDAEGHYRLWPVAIGKATVSASAPGTGRGNSAEIEVLRERDTDAGTLRLKPSNDADDSSPTGSTVAVALVDREQTCIISQVLPDSEAERSGLKVGDQLLSIDGVAPKDLLECRRRLAGPENLDLLLEVQRSGSRVKIRTAREPTRRP